MQDSLSASEYIHDNFTPSDRLAVLLRNRSTEEVIQRIASAEKIAAADFQQWLKERNQAGFDIYIGMNTLKGSAYSRTKREYSGNQTRLSRSGLPRSRGAQGDSGFR